MKRLALVTAFAVAALFTLPATASADGCYICNSGSSSECKNYCRYGSKDTQDARKACEKKGCKIGGTASCSTAANVKVCSMPVAEQPVQTASLDTLECAPN